MNERRWWAVAVGLLLIGAVGLGLGLRHPRDTLPGPAENVPVAPPLTAAAAAAAVPSDVVQKMVAHSIPVALRIPAIGLDVPVSALGLNPDGTVEVPTDYQEPGWFRLGPTPGQVGSAVILGHVDTKQGPAVFYHLRELRAGDRIEVSLAGGAVVHFAVRSVEMFRKKKFPGHRVYGSPGYSALQLITCGGKFEPPYPQLPVQPRGIHVLRLDHPQRRPGRRGGRQHRTPLNPRPARRPAGGGAHRQGPRGSVESWLSPRTPVADSPPSADASNRSRSRCRAIPSVPFPAARTPLAR